MYIRDLQSRIQFVRHDLPPGFTNQALQDAARWLARKTGIVKTKVLGHVDAYTVQVDLATFMGASTGDFVVLRPTQVMYCPGLDRNASSLGLLTATSYTIPLASVATPFGFYIATAPLTASDGVTAYPMFTGDVICAVNGAWKITPYYKYRIAKDVSKPRLMGAQQAPLNSVGYFANYIVDRGQLVLTPVPVNAVAVEIECSIVPNKEFDDIDIPVEAEDAVIYYAKALLHGMANKSGGGADIRLSDQYKKQADGEMSLVRAIADGNFGDTEMAPPPRFGA